MRYSFAGFLIFMFSTTVLADTTVPYTFTAGTQAKASEVNANFAALAAAINNLSSGVLPSGATLRGVWGPSANISGSTSGIDGVQYSVISFPLMLAAAPTFAPVSNHWLIGSATTTECPGYDINGLPQAAAGHLCVYQTNSDASSAVNTATKGAQWSRLGITLHMSSPSGTNALPIAEGSWAVTAP